MRAPLDRTKPRLESKATPVTVPQRPPRYLAGQEGVAAARFSSGRRHDDQLSFRRAFQPQFTAQAREREEPPVIQLDDGPQAEHQRR
jgi:hypothetical protein